MLCSKLGVRLSRDPIWIGIDAFKIWLAYWLLALVSKRRSKNVATAIESEGHESFENSLAAVSICLHRAKIAKTTEQKEEGYS